jgi:hypothetical protein
LVSALDWGSRGRGFKSPQPDEERACSAGPFSSSGLDQADDVSADFPQRRLEWIEDGEILSVVRGLVAAAVFVVVGAVVWWSLLPVNDCGKSQGFCDLPRSSGRGMILFAGIFLAIVLLLVAYIVRLIDRAQR